MASQPLKRFTQCGSLTIFFTVFVVLFGVSSTALTTFGKTAPNPPQPTVSPVKGPECSSHEACRLIQGTSCVKDPRDSRNRCLCGDNTEPDNGLCGRNVVKGLRHLCELASNCEEGMVCAVENATTSVIRSTFGVKQQQASGGRKVCLCDEANGYEEADGGYHCSGALSTLSPGLLVPTLALLLGSLLARRQH